MAQQEMKGVMSLKEVLHTFIFPSLSLDCLDSLPSAGKTDDQHTMGMLAEDEHRSNVKDTEDISVPKQNPKPLSDKKLSLSLALTVLERLLEKASADQTSLNFIEFEPLPLLVVLCDCYASSYSVLVTLDTEDNRQACVHLSRTHRHLRLVTEKCLSLLLSLAVRNMGLFSETGKCWLYQEVSERGWLHLSILAPILTYNSAWELQYCSVVKSLCKEINSSASKNTQKMVHLIQMALINTKMLSLISLELPSLLTSLSSPNILVALKWILITSMPSEMDRLVSVIKLLPVKPSYVLGDWMEQTVKPPLNIEETGTDVWQLDVCHKLTDTILLLDSSAESEAVRCHAITNYQAVIQSLGNSYISANVLVTLSTIFCQVCLALVSPGVEQNIPGSQAVQILQVTAMDVLTKLKVAMKKNDLKEAGLSIDETKSVGGKGTSKRKAGKKQTVHTKLLEKMSDCVTCITDATVKDVLHKQIRELVT